MTFAASADERDAPFRDQVAPLLERRCLSCHSQSERKGGLSLQTAAGLRAGGDSGEVVVAGDPESSYLLELVTAHNGRAEMPKDADPLDAAQVAMLRKWIADGARWPDQMQLRPPRVADFQWWSLQPLVRPAVPRVDAARRAWARTPIDLFIAARHAEHELQPSAEADRATLIRRLYYDLLGLPPDLEETRRFVEDTDPAAYERLVDRLLASPHYGERWARHWLDVVHYADTHGYDKDKPRPNAWPYRDYVIRSLNSDKPYGRFVTEQLAGDVLYGDSPDGIVATGFIAAGPWDFIGHAEVPETKTDGMVARNLDRDDMVSTTLNTFNSLTVQCARCHNHKFDPVTQEHYYGLQAVFAAVDRADRPFDADPKVARQRRQLEQAAAELLRQREELQRQLQAFKTPEITAIEARIETEKLRQQRDSKLTTAATRSPAYGYHSQVAARPDDRKWVQVDLGRPVPLEQVILVAADEYGWRDFGFPDRFLVQASLQLEPTEDDVLADFTRDSYPRPGSTPVLVDGRGRSVRYVRVTATRLWERRRNSEPDRGGAANEGPRNEGPGSGDWIFALGELAVVSGGRLLAVREVQSLDSIEAMPRWGRQNLVDGVYGKHGLDDMTAADRAESPTNGFHSQFANQADTTKWIQLDLGRTTVIDRVRLIPAFPTDWSDTPGFGFPQRFRLEVDDDPQFAAPRGVFDHSSSDFPNPGNRPLLIDCRGVEARYVRLTATQLWDRGGDQFALALAELEVESGGRNEAAQAVVSASDSIDSGRWHTRFLNDGRTSRTVLANHAATLQSLSAASSATELARLAAERDRLLKMVVDPKLPRQQADVERRLAENETRQKQLPPPKRIYAGVVHSGSGTFRGREGLGPRPIHLLHRGNVTQPGPLVPPGAIPLAPDQQGAFELPADHEEGERRAALARWLVADDHPLTWRSIANRIWLYHFGRGIVDSPNDFGRMGQLPTHPRLLDWLAVEMRDGPPGVSPLQSWKRLHRLIVTSSVYRQASDGSASSDAVDRDNRFLWRMNRRRLDAESLRDTVLQACDKLDRRMYGPGFQDFVIERPEHSPHYEYDKHDPDDPSSHRRAIYRFIVRSQQQPFMETLDCADPSQLVARRNETLTSLQALALLNNRFMLRMAEHLANRVQAETADPAGQLALAYRLTLGRAPDGDERRALAEYLEQFGLPNTCRLLLNLNEFVFVD